MLHDSHTPTTREKLRIASLELPGWRTLADRTPRVGDFVYCIEGHAEVVRVLGKVSDGSRLLELRLGQRPEVPFFAATSNVLQSAEE